MGVIPLHRQAMERPMDSTVQRYQDKISAIEKEICDLLEDGEQMSYIDDMICGANARIADAPRISRDDLIARHRREIERYRGLLALNRPTSSEDR